ncbi:hypothetical protein EIZ87_23000, partial [Escherichia coli]|nr:hypothetical protein [Escherichia coli]
VFVWKQNYILVDEYFFFCCTWIVNSAYIKVVVEDLRIRGYADYLPAYNLDDLRRFALQDDRPSLVRYIDNVMATV